MVEIKFDGLNRIENMNSIIKASAQDVEHSHINRVKCSIPKHRKIFTKDGKKIYGSVEVEIIKSKGSCSQLTVIKDKVGSITFEVEGNIIKLR